MKKKLLLWISLIAVPGQALEMEAKEFFFCVYKKATNMEARTIRIHQFPEENKCAVVYSVNGKDNMVSYGRWLSFCKSKMDQVSSNLQKSLWQCEKQENPVTVFYSFSKKPVQDKANL